MSDKTPEQQRQLGGELLIPVLSIAFTLYYFSTIINSPWTAQVSAFMLGGFLLFVCAIFIVKALHALVAREGSLGFGNLFTREDLTTGRVWLLIATVGYCWFISDLGFTLTTFLFLAVSMAVLSHWRRLALIIGIAAAMSLGGWAVFIWAFDTRFPRGWFETFMAGVLSGG